MDRLLTRLALARACLILAAGLSAAAPAVAANAAHGRSVFSSQCGTCHSVVRNGPTIVGPSLFGVVGRPSGSVKGFAYSKPMKAAGLTWSDGELHTYLPAPAKTVPGTHMGYSGLKNAAQLDDLIAYLDTLK